MKIAIVGAGISGLTTAHLLHRDHEIVLFEAGDRIGGHSHTVDVQTEAGALPVDTGFVVFNDRTYPNFRRLLAKIGVGEQPTSMSFSVHDESSGLEYNGTSLDTLFAQRRNLFRPSFWRMIREILRFHREAPRLLEAEEGELPLGEFLDRGRYAREFVDHYILPMGGAIWSASADRMRTFPARFFVRFFMNHGMLSVGDRPQWKTVKGGSRSYVEALTRPFRDRIRLNSPVERIDRDDGGTTVLVRGRPPERFDKTIIAAHSDQALAMLAEPTREESEVLGAIAYQRNDTVLHTDGSVLPKSRRARAAWNAFLPKAAEERVTITYSGNILHGHDVATPLCVSLNRDAAIDPKKIAGRYVYHHPVFTTAATAAQARFRELNGKRHTYFAGAYWRYGFHEDGVLSALAVAEHFGVKEIA